ncbi:glutamate carboxypeptidase, putative [Ixodes scapularis]|uniref:Glutamate carboxypeptidase, putative n=1 Tax=Ixodes scapularis TaxID=6945 RepID=B7QI09_IXOSC|nr:glutamate carboxypeptidase, putative [Ixodes scapularis]|eukprot:XP_002414816.1 glutamate carboxypeptidase, putative [Ixodes scapularis]
MSAQYRPYRDDDNGTDSEPMTWADQEPGSVQIYEKTTEDIRVVSHRNLVIGGVGIALLGLLAGLLAGYFAHTQHSGCVRGKSVAIHAVFDADPTIRDRLLQMVSAQRINDTVRTLLSPDAQTDDQLVELLRTTWSRHGLESVERDSYDVLLSFPDAVRPNRLEIRDGATREMVSSFDLFSAEHKPYVAYAPAGSIEGPVVYASHLGHREVDALHELNVTLEGSVLLARLGLYPPAYQIGLAQLVGAKALLLYPDPAEFHPTLAQNTVASSPWWLPNDGTPSLSALANILGDPQTPGYPATRASALSVSASPLLYHAVFNATKQVPEGARTVYDQWARVFPMRRNVSHLLFPPSVEPGEEDVFEEEDELPPFLLDPVPRELLASYVHAAMLPTRPA